MSTMHLSLFDDDPSFACASSALVLRASGRPLSKKERTVNRLLAKVQMLRSRLDSEKRRLDDALIVHAAEVRPRIVRAVSLRKDLVRALTPFLDDRRLKPGDRRVLATIVAAQLEDILMHDEVPEHDLRELFERLHGVAYTDAAQAQLDDARSDVEALFAQLGLDVQVPELRADMTDEEMAATVAEMADCMRRSADARIERERLQPRTRREARAQERRRRFEEMHKAGIGVVYKRLVKALHPDLERDPDLRARKGELMQEVTTAYERNDLHTLLRLELEWIHCGSADAARLTDETLDAYAAVLREQVNDLVAECDALQFHPRYASLVEEDPFGRPIVIDGPTEARRLDGVIDALRAAVERMRSGHACQEVRGAIREYRQAQRSAAF